MKGLQKIFNLYVGTALVVILSYAFLACDSLNKRWFSVQPMGHYQYLTESFLQGKTYLNIEVPKKLLELKNPFDFEQNKNIIFNDGVRLHDKLHDASVYHGKFYLYFGPLPVVTLYLPWKLLTGWYMPDNVGVFIFLSLGFMICFRLLYQIKNTYFPHISEREMCFVGLILGFANNAPFLLMRPSFYEAAIASAFCFVSLALFFLYRLFHHHFKLKDIFMLSTCLTLSAYGRPHFALLSFFMLPLLFLYLYCFARQKMLIRTIILFLPAALIGSLFLAYNYVRFDSFFEFGQSYQLLSYRYGLEIEMFQWKDIGSNMALGFYHYFLRPFLTLNIFPFVFFPDLFLERVSNGHIYEGTFGLLKTVPFIIFILLLPAQIKFYLQKESYRTLIKFILFFTFATSIIVLFLFSLCIASQRYLSDFSTFVIMLAILSYWLSQSYVREEFFKIFRLFFIATGMLSIYIGIIQAKSLVFIGAYFKDVNFTLINDVIFSAMVMLAFLFFYRLYRPNRIK